MGLQNLIGEVAQTVAGGLGTGQGAACADLLAGQNAGELVAQLPVHAEHVADLSCTGADVAGGHIGVSADVAVQLSHECLAEAHDLGVGLALGVEVAAALAAAHGQAGQGILEDLLEAQELHNGQVDGGVQTDAALVGADGGVVLDTVATVDLDIALVVGPGDTEDDGALRLDDAVDDLVLDDVGAALHDGLQRGQNLLDSLQELLLTGVALAQAGVHTLQIFIVDSHNKSLLMDQFASRLSPLVSPAAGIWKTMG